MLLIQKENSTTKVGYVKMFDFIFSKSQTTTTLTSTDPNCFVIAMLFD